MILISIQRGWRTVFLELFKYILLVQAEQIDDEIAELRRQEVEDIRQRSMGQYPAHFFRGIPFLAS